MYKWKLGALVLLLVAFTGTIAATLYAVASGAWPTGKLLGTASALAALASIAQLSVSGLWEEIIAFYKDRATDFPNGPPSHITRRIISNPDAPLRSGLRAYVIFNTSTAVWLAIISAILGGVAAWF